MDRREYEGFKAIFGMAVNQYYYYDTLMLTPIEEWPEPGKTELFGKDGVFNRCGMSNDFVRETIAQYAMKHYTGAP